MAQAGKQFIRPLQDQGLKVVAAPIPLTSLSDDAAALKRTIARTQGPFIAIIWVNHHHLFKTTMEECHEGFCGDRDRSQPRHRPLHGNSIGSRLLGRDTGVQKHEIAPLRPLVVGKSGPKSTFSLFQPLGQAQYLAFQPTVRCPAGSMPRPLDQGTDRGCRRTRGNPAR